jgi:DNA-binding response OmpR family regulator
VDDDESVLQTFGKALALEGYDVRIAASPLDGLYEAELAPPDVILLDLRMPFVNGIGFLYRLRAQPTHRNTPVAIITGDSGIDDSALIELRELGAELLFKPIWLDEVLTLTRSMLARRSPDMAEPELEHEPLTTGRRIQLPVRAARPHPPAS